MTAVIRKVSKAELTGLISSSNSQTLSDDGKAILQLAVARSHWLWLGEVDGKLLCFYGLWAPTLMSSHAYLWLHVTPALRQHSFVFIRHSQRAIEEMLQHYESILGHCEAHNTRAQAWLRMLGAKFDYPAESTNLIPFEIRAREHG